MKSETIGSEFKKSATACYIGYMLLVFVLSFRNKYFDISETKRAFYLYGTGFYIVIMSILSLMKSELSLKKLRSSLLGEEGLLCALFGGLIITWLAGVFWNIDLSASFWGNSDKCTGLLLYLVGAAAILFIHRSLLWNGLLSWIFLGSTATVYVLQILNRFSVDPFHMYENLITIQIPAFLSTLGHMNYNASFNCIMLGANLVFFLNSKERLSQILYGACLFLGYLGSVCCNSDSVFLGIAISFLAGFWYVLSHPQKQMQLWLCTILFFFASCIIAIAYALPSEPVILVGGPTVFLDAPILIAEFLLIALLFVLFSFDLKQDGKCTCFLRFCSCGFLYLLLPLCALLPIVGSLHEALASGRGLIWKKCLTLFVEADLPHKLLGFGFNNVRTALEAYQGNSYDISGTDVIMDAHNIALNTLVTSGILGVLLWGAFLFLLLKKGLQLCADHEYALFIVVGICTYITQGIVNGPQIITTPIFLVELGILWGIAYKQAPRSS